VNNPVQCSFLTDSNGRPLEGRKIYCFHLPARMPDCNFWSLIVYESETDLIIRNDQPWPSIHSNCKSLETNRDGSVDALFGPDAPTDKMNNWIKTIPGRNWYLILRLYDISEPVIDKSWKPGDVEEIDEYSFKKNKKSDGPSCACGKEDLYENFIKQINNKKT
jgi:hypothetical protein